jgi:hypothetical protein
MNTPILVRRFVVAGFAARFAVHQSISANANVDDCLAQAAEFFALACGLRLFALHAAVLRGAGSSAHEARLVPAVRGRNMTEVTKTVISGPSLL